MELAVLQGAVQRACCFCCCYGFGLPSRGIIKADVSVEGQFGQITYAQVPYFAGTCAGNASTCCSSTCTPLQQPTPSPAKAAAAAAAGEAAASTRGRSGSAVLVVTNKMAVSRVQQCSRQANSSSSSTSTREAARVRAVAASCYTGSCVGADCNSRQPGEDVLGCGKGGL